MSTGEMSRSSFEQRPERAEYVVMPISETADASVWPPSALRVDATGEIHGDIRKGNRLDWTAYVTTQRSGVLAQPSQTVSIDELFANLESTHHLRRALDLLGESIKLVESALASDGADPIACDDQMQLFYSLLPELFCCRSVGDGFGSIINAVQQAAANQLGVPMDRKQMESLLSVLRCLRYGPFIPHQDAVEMIIKLEDAGLMVDPPALAEVADTPQDGEAGVR